MRIGIDFGGTKIEAILFDDAGSVLFRKRIATPQGDYQATLDAIASLIREADQYANGQASVGVAIPGAISPATGLVKNANSTWIIGQPLDRDLEAIVGRPVRIANDANCFALSEAIDGAGRGAHTVFGVIVGTGTGGGIVVDGKVLVGRNAIAGEWGHTALPWPQAGEHPGPQCFCGQRGCIETFLSGPAFARDHMARNGKHATPEEIIHHARGGDAAAVESLEIYCHRMAKALAMVINLLDPDVIVVGGGLSEVEELYQRVPVLWRDYVFSDTITTPLLQAHHGSASGVRGAAWLWPPEPDSQNATTTDILP